MCELFCLSSRQATVVNFSLEAFARRGGRNGRNIDGWGLAYYDDHDVRLYREPEPAGDSTWLGFIERRHIASTLILSHIRHATRGRISLANTQPFARELGGRVHVFAHNGRLDDIEIRHGGEWDRFRPIGDTDSEIAYCILLERLSELWRDGAEPPLDERLAIVEQFASDMRQLGPANFIYSDGRTLFAHGHRRIQADGLIAPPGLWQLHRRCAADIDALPDAGVAIEPGRQDQEITLLASVPLTAEPWRPLAEGEILVVKDGHDLSRAEFRTLRGSSDFSDAACEGCFLHPE
ncbi:class II glutamine amidotransferase [Bradyrhizobium erythrophlei]|uniref:class II glutamine amidotransferase n=1 Tax=Bradyrhizobium erythrophlei TaxID=1437360 RepID=UPI0035F004AB